MNAQINIALVRLLILENDEVKDNNYQNFRLNCSKYRNFLP